MSAVVLGLALVWLAAEVVLQVRGWRMGAGGGTREWRSFVLLVVLGVSVGFLTTPMTGWLRLPHHLGFWVGVPVAVVGIGVRLWAIVALGRFFRGIVNVQSDHRVVRSGPYAWVRHPSYSGALLGIVGFSLTSGSVVVATVTTTVMAVGFAYRIVVEERALRAGLGEAYEAYAAVTPRLVPRVGRARDLAGVA